MLPKTDAAKYAESKSNTTLLPTGKIRFDQTGMEFPPNVTRSVLDAYANGKAFRRAVIRRQNEAYDFSVHQPYVVPHKDRDQRHFLYCLVTKVTLPRDRSTVQKHVSAKRFKRLLREREEMKQKKEERADKRREKRAKQAAAKEAANGNGEKKPSRAAIERPDVLMEHDGNDVLDGIISDDDESIDSDAEANPSEEKTNRADAEILESDRMEEDEVESEEKDTTVGVRGAKGARHAVTHKDEDDDDEPKKRNLRTTRSKKKKNTKKSTLGTSKARANDSQTPETVTGKRNRMAVQVPKKVRQARQRRKTGQRE